MEIKVLEMTDLAQAAALSVKVKDFSELYEGPEIDEQPKEIDGKFYVHYIVGLDISAFSSYIMSTMDKMPDEVALDEASVSASTRNEEGFALYTKIIADSKLSGGLNPSEDTSMAMYAQMHVMRNMLKDGLFEWALRKFHREMAAGFPVDMAARYTGWLEDINRKYGVPEAVITALKDLESM